MFRKNVTTAGTHQLGGKDVKKLKAYLTQQLPALTEEQRDLLLPPKAAITQLKLSNRSLVYSAEGVHGGNPLVFDPNGRGDKLLPTVYALALLPHLIPVLLTPSEVSPKVIGGADLFLQGLILPEGGPAAMPEFLAGSVRALAVPGNPVPFAVGTMAVSKTEALREGIKGRGLTVLHSFGDLLWQLGDAEPPNEGFQPARVFPLGIAEAGASPAAGSAGNDGSAPADAAVEAAADRIEGLRLMKSGNSDANGSGNANGDDSIRAEADGAPPAGTAPDAWVDSSPAAAASVGMDTLVEAAVVGGLHALKSGELPMMASDFYTKCMQPLKPPGITFDFKQTRYKKLSKLLDRFEKDKVLTQKQIRKQDHITAVNRSHPQYLAWEGMPGSDPGAGARGASGNGNGNGGGVTGAARTSGQGGAGSSGSRGGTTKVEVMYKVPASLRPLFGEVGARDKEAMYSETEVGQALESYARVQGLAVQGGIKLDHLLSSTMYGKKEAPAEGCAVPSAELGRRLLDKLLTWHRISRPGDEGGRPIEVVRRGGVKPITVTVERRRGHNVTAVTRVEGFAFVAEELAGVFARRLKTASSVSKLPGKAESDSEILLQGDLLRQVAAYFTEVAGLEAGHLELVNKLKK